jgi:acyl-lipid omega-6 desaturase (Delta-12 desaturase)
VEAQTGCRIVTEILLLHSMSGIRAHNTDIELILATKPFAQESRAVSWKHSITAFILLCTSFFFAVLPTHPAIQIISGICAGLLNVRMFVIYHDQQHGAIHRKDKFAGALFWVYGLFTLAPSSIWKRSHDYHHKHNSKLYTASIGSYPIMSRTKFESCSEAEKRAYLFSRHPVTIAFGYFSMFMFGMCVNSFRSSPSRHWDSLLALVLHISLYVCCAAFAGWISVIASVALPCLITFAIGAYLFYAQHNFPGVRFTDKPGWTYEGAAMESSSYMQMNPFMQWICANIGFHHIHHLNAKVPFYRLPEAYEKVKEFRNVTVTSLHPKDIAACFRLKIWDSEKREMIPLSN